MIELQDISKTFYRGTSHEVTALNNLNLKVETSQFVVVVGTNGSGKSSFINALSGTIRTDGGKILFDTIDVTRLKEHERSKWVARVFQNPLMGTAPELSILENFRLASLRTHSKKLTIGTGDRFKNKTREKISLLNLGLENKVNQPMGTLSGGQRQALTLLMAVMDETKILLMDEPAAALDPKTSDLLMNLTAKIVREFRLTTLLITHRLKDVLAFGDRVILIKEGEISKDIRNEEKSKLQLHDIYGWF